MVGLKELAKTPIKFQSLTKLAIDLELHSKFILGKKLKTKKISQLQIK